MSALIEHPENTVASRPPGAGRRVGVVGVPLGFGCGIAGVDLGDLRIEQPRVQCQPGEKAKYLAEISAACELVAAEVQKVLRAGELPVVLGGDHSIAVGSVAGVTAVARARGAQ